MVCAGIFHECHADLHVFHERILSSLIYPDKSLAQYIRQYMLLFVKILFQRLIMRKLTKLCLMRIVFLTTVYSEMDVQLHRQFLIRYTCYEMFWQTGCYFGSFTKVLLWAGIRFINPPPPVLSSHLIAMCDNLIDNEERSCGHICFRNNFSLLLLFFLDVFLHKTVKHFFPQEWSFLSSVLYCFYSCKFYKFLCCIY